MESGECVMGKASREKGYRGEHEVVLICQGNGVSAKRNWMSGIGKLPDVEINNRPVSIKRRKNGMAWAYEELGRHDYILFRADNKRWIKIQYWDLEQK